ncbi:hypothetical protein FB45DRAFT_1056543 [Roridomyces roridus]|uniref:BTB domain-containing protein n=1 Tax=Roridomyces roridus TaxID=1738132 RepID=A0AAD7FNG5_9AGAR|nr:hypothetical protein FB45DRAFT_1056543 [Roridomyces roridus]
MSSTAPSAKRQRTEEETTPTRSHIWKPFGDIVLQVESTQFRVSRDVLATQSPVFADMFSVPQPPNEPTVEACPVVILSGDTAKDWELLLVVLYEPFDDKEMRTFDEIAAMLRLGRKYGISTAEANALGRIRFEYPSDCAQWEERVGCDELSKIEDYSGIALDLLKLAYEFGINSCIPTLALNCLAVYSPDDIFNGIERFGQSRINLPPEIQTQLAFGFMKIMQFQREAYPWLDNDEVIPSELCQDKTKCTASRHTIRRSLSWNDSTDSALCFLLDVWDAEWSKSLCDSCAEAGATIFDATRAKAWEALPTFFGLAKWEGLKDLE